MVICGLKRKNLGIFALKNTIYKLELVGNGALASGCIVKAPLGKRSPEGESEATGSNPNDRGKSGTKRHLLTDQNGIPLSVVISGANRHDMKKLDDLLEATLFYPPLDVKQHLCLDRGYDYSECRMRPS